MLDSISNNQQRPKVVPRNLKMKHDESGGLGFITPPNNRQKGNVSEHLRTSSKVTQPINSEKKVGRNDPCICGSGKKYKKCCG